MSSKSINFAALLEEAAERAGGVRALARLLEWDHSAILKIRSGDRISPYRAQQLAQFLGMNPRAQTDAMFSALADLAKAEPERQFWRGRIGEAPGVKCSLGIDLNELWEKAWHEAQEDWTLMRVQPSAERKIADAGKRFKEYVDQALVKAQAQKATRKAG